MQLTQQLTYRLYTPNDLPGILSLWENYSGWGAITAEQFNEWYVDTPYGSCPVIIAESEPGEIVGQLSLTPADIFVHGKTVKGLRLSAPILHSDFRWHDLRSGEHPAFRMIKHGVDKAKEMGYSMMYSLPAHGWLALLKMFPRLGLPDIQLTSFDCVSLSLTDTAVTTNYSSPGLDVSVIEKADAVFDALWKDAAVSFPVNCGIARDSRWVNWKIANKHHLLLQVKHSNHMIGYAAYKKKDGLLADILARTPGELKDTLLASVNAMHFTNEKRIPADFEEVKLMCSPVLTPVLDSLPVHPVNFQFAFSCYPLNTSLNNEHIIPGNWYVMPLD